MELNSEDPIIIIIITQCLHAQVCSCVSFLVCFVLMLLGETNAFLVTRPPSFQEDDAASTRRFGRARRWGALV